MRCFGMPTIIKAIYWFANDWHGGQASELYSILSTSLYKPGPLSTLASEGDTVGEMYKALEDEFTNEGASTKVSTSVDEALEIELASAKLKAEAIKACIDRGHEMVAWEDDRTPSRIVSTTACKICGMQVQVNTKPAPNEINIGGEAVALNCKEEYEMATPEEIRRELGE